MNVFTPAETAANYAAAGVLKTRQPFLKLLILGIAAGALIGFPVCVTNMATYAITNASAVRIMPASCLPSAWASWCSPVPSCLPEIPSWSSACWTGA